MRLGTLRLGSNFRAMHTQTYVCALWEGVWRGLGLGFELVRVRVRRVRVRVGQR
jgi:hypothetical protein